MPYLLLAKDFSEVIMSNKPVFETGDFLVKSLRFDQFCYIDEFLDGITRTQDQPKPRAPRWKPHKKFTVYADNIYNRLVKVSPYPEAEYYKKALTSPHQSLSLIPSGTNLPVFGIFKERSNALVGIITDPRHALFNRFFTEDGSTVDRPYEFDTQELAQKYAAAKKDILYNSYDLFKSKILKNHGKGHNEVLARIRWTNSNAIGIFSDTDESRYIAQVYARKLRAVLAAKAGKLPEDWDPSYEVPIYYYIPGSPKHLKVYTLEEMRADEEKANHILSSRESRNQAFHAGCFAFLLLAKDPRAALDIKWGNLGNEFIVIALIRLNLFHIAKDMVERAGYKNISAYLQANGLVTEAYKVCSWGSESTHQLVRSNRIDILNIVAEIANPKEIDAKYSDGDTPLVLAAYLGHTDLVSFLLRRGAPDISRNANGDTALICASREGHVDVVKVLLQQNNHSKHYTNAQGKNALYWAGYKQNWEMVALLSDDNVATLIDEYKYTALVSAIQNQNQKTFNKIVTRINKPAAILDIRAKKYAKSTPLILELLMVGWFDIAENLAKQAGYTDIVDYLRKKALITEALIVLMEQKHIKMFEIICNQATLAEITTNSAYSRAYSPWGYALNICGDVKYASLILKQFGVDNLGVNNIARVLHVAVVNGEDELVRLLVAHIPSQAIPLQDLHSYFSIAAKNTNFKMIDFLLARMPVTDLGNDGKALFMSIVRHHNHFSTIRLLFQKGFQLASLTSAESREVLLWAAEKGHYEIICQLFAHNKKLSCNIHNEQGNTPLILAAQHGHHEIASFLLKRNTQVNTKNKNNLTALEIAVRYSHQKLVVKLLENGAIYVDAALEDAMKKNHPNLIPLLLEKLPSKANPKIKLETINKVLVWAASAGHRNLVSLMLTKGANVNLLSAKIADSEYKRNHPKITALVANSLKEALAIELQNCINKNYPAKGKQASIFSCFRLFSHREHPKVKAEAEAAKALLSVLSNSNSIDPVQNPLDTHHEAIKNNKTLDAFYQRYLKIPLPATPSMNFDYIRF